MGDVVDFRRKDALFSNDRREYYAKRLEKAHGFSPDHSRNAVHAMEVEMCESIVATARQIAKIVGYRLGNKLFRLITKEDV